MWQCRDVLAPWHAKLLMQLAAAVAEQDASNAIPYIAMAIETSKGTSTNQLVSPCNFRLD